MPTHLQKSGPTNIQFHDSQWANVFLIQDKGRGGRGCAAPPVHRRIDAEIKYHDLLPIEEVLGVCLIVLGFTIETADVDLDECYVRGHPASTPGPYVMLSISDNAIDMDAETERRIFEPFLLPRGKGEGTGLGLSTVYGIVKQSNGSIWVAFVSAKGPYLTIRHPQVSSATRHYASISVGTSGRTSVRSDYRSGNEGCFVGGQEVTNTISYIALRLVEYDL